MAVPGRYGKRSQPAGRNLADPRFSLITLKSLNGFRSPPPCTIQLSSGSSVTSPAMFLAKADSSRFANSSWLASIVLPHQPHFIGQPKDVDVFWGYGLFVDKLGDFVKKPMHACTGREIMTEIMGHLRIEAEALRILETSTCIPCMMPFITSQFLRREIGDRPQPVPRDGPTWPSLDNFVSWRTTWFSPLNIPSGLRWPRYTDCSA